MFPRLTDLLPCCARIQSEFGRLMPIGVVGAASPDSTTTVITLPVIPRDVRLLVPVEDRRMILEPLRLARDRVDPPRRFGIAERHHRLERSAQAERIVVHLDEAVDHVDERVGVRDPSDVVLVPVRKIAAAVVAQSASRARRAAHRSRRRRLRCSSQYTIRSMRFRIQPADLPHFLDDAPVAFDEPGVEPMRNRCRIARVHARGVELAHFALRHAAVEIDGRAREHVVAAPCSRASHPPPDRRSRA